MARAREKARLQATGCDYTGAMNRAGQYHGEGLFTFADGTTHAGTFIKGKMSGRGKRSYPDGGWWKGVWEDGKRAGKGKGRQIGDSTVYEGGFAGEVRHGAGVLTFDSGDRYEGACSGQPLSRRDSRFSICPESGSEASVVYAGR